ncbi:MAG TPA: TonB family protein [Opitutaceae bacterium]|jgi:TonB family protein|nr:TonB family protein [Opitutaceae bacterium]
MNKNTRFLLALVFSNACAFPSAALAEADREPVATYQERPEYPFSLRLEGKRGEVLLEFIVMPDGSVSSPEVIKSSHPDFEAPAVEALLKWKFKPGIHDGHVVYTRMRVPIIFQLEHMPDGSNGYSMWRLPERGSKTFPPQFQYDEAPVPQVTSAPVYPFELLEKKVKGKAEVTFTIDPRGRARVVKVLSASQPEFAAATVAMIEAWSFEPAKKDGKPCWALLRKEQVFSRNEDDFPLNESAERLLKSLKKDPCPIIKDSHLLDSVPKGRFLPSPIVPPALEASNARADAVVEFVIDHAGHAQLPRVTSASDPAFGWAAATAVARWQFSPPTQHGKPVDMFARIPLSYNPPGQAPAGP